MNDGEIRKLTVTLQAVRALLCGMRACIAAAVYPFTYSRLRDSESGVWSLNGLIDIDHDTSLPANCKAPPGEGEREIYLYMEKMHMYALVAWRCEM